MFKIRVFLIAFVHPALGAQTARWVGGALHFNLTRHLDYVGDSVSLCPGPQRPPADLAFSCNSGSSSRTGIAANRWQLPLLADVMLYLHGALEELMPVNQKGLVNVCH